MLGLKLIHVCKRATVVVGLQHSQFTIHDSAGFFGGGGGGGINIFMSFWVRQSNDYTIELLDARRLPNS